MPKLAVELKALEVGRLKVPGLHAVGTVPGLQLQVTKDGARSWVLRVMIGGKRRDMGLGGYPAVTLAGAFEKAREARALIAEGIDPIQRRREAQSALRAAQGRTITFEQAAEQYIVSHGAGWKNAKHRGQWQATLATYAYPKVGKLMVGDVALPHVLSILEPIWQTKTETASRVRGRVESVLDWATARGYRNGENPARWRGHLDKLLARPSKIAKPEHFSAVRYTEIGEFMVKLRAMSGVAPCALEFAILTAARSGEVFGATWGEFDLEAAVWTVPAERMKAGREHRVPLSDVALAVLRAQSQRAADAYVFPGQRGGMLSNMSMTAVMKRLGADAVPHGFRSTFSDWVTDRTSYPSEVREMALAHTIANKAEAAYRRGDIFEKRRRLMRDWAAFVGTPSGGEKVVPIRTGSRVHAVPTA